MSGQINNNTNLNEKIKERNSSKEDSNLNDKDASENINNKNNSEINKNKLSSFNNIQISSNNHNSNSNKGIEYTYISSIKEQKLKSKQNFQISSINSNNNKFSNNDSHQGICFIANNPKENSKDFLNKTKINSQQGISYIASQNQNKEKKFSIESNNFSESHYKGITYIAPENSMNKKYHISPNYNNTQLNSVSQGISFLSKENPKPKEINKNFKIISSSNKNPNDIISYIAPEIKKGDKYKIEYNPSNNKEEKNGICYIAQNKSKQYSLSSSFKNSHQEIKYLTQNTPISEEYKISSNHSKDNNNINLANSTQLSFISDKPKKISKNYQLSSQSNTYSYIAPVKIDTSLDKNSIDKKNNNNDLTISSNKNNFIYISENKPNKISKQEKKENGENSNNFKFNHNESITFICEGEISNDNKTNKFIKCDGDNFKYIKDLATGAQIFEENKN